MNKKLEPDLKSDKITEQINATAFKILKNHPEGLHWSELVTKIQDSNSTFHPKTINGCVWKLTNNFPDKIYKPSRGVFCLLEYK